ncbi:MAG: hypothetical protein M3381_10530 [Actinomycetota bacterium]|nr:hypothetical protein [Actinomycetota bacterium]
MGGDENNNWLTKGPVKGDSTGGFPGGSGIEVRPDGLKLFSTQAEGEAKNFSSGFQDGVMPLSSASARIGSSFMEAAQFSARHGQAIAKTTELSKDVTIGLASLGMGAKTIAINYINGDATSAATLPEVLDAFDATKSNGLREMIEGDGQGTRGGNSGGGNLVRLPEGHADQSNTSSRNPNDPAFANTIKLGDNASYTVPGAPDCQDIEVMDREDFQAVESQVRDDLAKENYKQAPYNPDNYR